jgi:hypothetical protein
MLFYKTNYRPNTRAQPKRTIKELRRLLQKTTQQTNTDSSTVPTEPPTQVLPLAPADIAAALHEAGYYDYLCARHNAHSGKDNADRIVKAVAKFIDWSHRNIKDKSFYNTQRILPWLKTLIKTHYTAISAYCTYLADDEHHAKPATVKQRVQQIHGLFLWYAVYCAKLPLSSLEGVKAVAGDVRRAASRKMRALKAADTLKKRIEDRRLPPNGLADLLRAVYSLVPWARSLQGQGVDKDTYDAFMQLLYAAMYVSSPQGRQSGLMDLKYEQHKALLDKGFANTTRFKTQDKYIYQPVTLSAVTKELLGVYLQHLRPIAARGLPPRNLDPLWLKYSGVAEDGLGRKVVRFFTAQLGLHITTTAIRSLVETAMYEKYKEGEITLAQKESVHTINGHSSQVTQDYYIKEDMARGVAQARDAFEVITEQVLPEGQEAVPFPGWADREVFSAAEWGADHPDRDLPVHKKARWTADEIAYIGAYCDRQTQANPDHRTVVACCLQQLRLDPAAQRVFHERHVLDSARLRHGYRKYLDMTGEGRNAC